VGNKHFSLLSKFVNYGQKKFYNIGPWSCQFTTVIVYIVQAAGYIALTIVNYDHKTFIIQANDGTAFNDFLIFFFQLTETS